MTDLQDTKEYKGILYALAAYSRLVASNIEHERCWHLAGQAMCYIQSQ